VIGSPDLPDEADAKADGATAAGPTLPAEIKWIRHSAEFRAASLQAYALATARIERMVEEEDLAPGTWAVGLDGDETTWSNAAYEQERALLGLGYSWQSWRRWVQRREATALPGVAAFLARVRELGGRAVIVTNRSATECPDTIANVSALGLAVDLIMCKRGSQSEKEARWGLIESGRASTSLPAMRIVMYVGDNIQDFPDLTQAIRTEDDAAFGDFGDHFVMIPNPMYGSWERNPIQ
jgi:5'-nucleotidase (lipoprotein e(P4) family)